MIDPGTGSAVPTPAAPGSPTGLQFAFRRTPTYRFAGDALLVGDSLSMAAGSFSGPASTGRAEDQKENGRHDTRAAHSPDHDHSTRQTRAGILWKVEFDTS